MHRGEPSMAWRPRRRQGGAISNPLARWVKEEELSSGAVRAAGPEVVALLRDTGVAGVPRSRTNMSRPRARCLPAGGGAGYRTEGGLRRQSKSAGSSEITPLRRLRLAHNVLANPLSYIVGGDIRAPAGRSRGFAAGTRHCPGHHRTGAGGSYRQRVRMGVCARRWRPRHCGRSTPSRSRW